MQIKTILAGAAIALAAGVGSASAGDEFSTLDGIAVAPMNAMELDGVRGGNGHGAGPPGLIIVTPGSGPTIIGAGGVPGTPPPIVVTPDGSIAGP